MRSECVFCRAALTPETRAPTRSAFTRSGMVPSRKSWCCACDDLSAPARAKRLLEAERNAARREYFRAYMAQYNHRPEIKAAKYRDNTARRFRQRASFRCAECHGRFPGNRQAWRLQDGRRVRLGLCAFCASLITSGKPQAA